MTPLMREAIGRDVLGQYSEAIRHYELELSKNPHPAVETYLNLGFIYGELASEPPFSFDEGISDRWSVTGLERYNGILEKGISRYPENLELHLWRKYFPYRLQYDEFSRDDSEHLFAEFPDDRSLASYFFLWIFNPIKYAEERQRLLIECDELPTAKNRHIRSVLLSNAVERKTDGIAPLS